MTDSRKGDWVFLVNEDISDLKLDMSEDTILKMSKHDWKVHIHAKFVRRKSYKK